MTDNPQDHVPTFGEIYWDEYRASMPDDHAEYVAPWERLPGDVREQVETGAQAVAVVAVQRRIDELDAQAVPEPGARYALVEQMGHRSTVATVREVTFCSQPMLEVTELETGSVHLVSPQSIYEISWLDEATARARAKPWTATAITAGQQLAYDEDAEAGDLGDVDPFTLGGDPIEADEASYQAHRAAEADL